MGQLQIFRDYKLTFHNDDRTELLSLSNNNPQGIGLRVVFNLDILNSTSQALTSSEGGTQFGYFRIYNLSGENLNRIKNQKLSYIRFEAGYRDKAYGGNTNRAVLVDEGLIINSQTWRDGVNTITEINIIPYKSGLQAQLDKEDLIKYKKDHIKKRYFTPKQVFISLVKKYLPNVIISEKLLTGFDTKYDGAKTDAYQGYVFTQGTTIQQALNKVAGSRFWMLDPRGFMHVYTSESAKQNLEDASFPKVDLNQQTGLLGLPILSPAGTIRGKALLNPAIMPMTYLKIKGTGSFRRSQSLVAITAPTFEEATVLVLSVNISGDSRGGEWVTNFLTLDVGYGVANNEQ